MPQCSFNQTPKQSARKGFIDLVAQDDAAIDLAQAALLIALEEYPDLDIAGCLAHLDLLARQVCATLGVSEPDKLMRLPGEVDPLTAIEAINQVPCTQEQSKSNQTAN